jgi:hypothetical protein
MKILTKYLHKLTDEARLTYIGEITEVLTDLRGFKFSKSWHTGLQLTALTMLTETIDPSVSFPVMVLFEPVHLDDEDMRARYDEFLRKHCSGKTYHGNMLFRSEEQFTEFMELRDEDTDTFFYKLGQFYSIKLSKHHNKTGSYPTLFKPQRLEASTVDEVATLASLVRATSASGAVYQLQNTNLVMEMNVDVREGCVDWREASSQGSEVASLIMNFVDTEIRSGRGVIHKLSGQSPRQLVLDRLKDKREAIQLWISHYTEAHGKNPLRFSETLYKLPENSLEPDKSWVKCQILKREDVDGTSRVVSVKDMHDTTYTFAANAVNPVLYNALDSGQFLYMWRDKSTNNITLVVGSLAGTELTTGVDWNQKHLREFARRMTTSRRNVGAHYSMGFDKMVYRGHENLNKQAENLTIEVFVLNKKASKRMLAGASGSGVIGLSTHSLSSLYQTRLTTPTSRLAFNDLLYTADKITYQGQEVWLEVLDYTNEAPGLDPADVDGWSGNFPVHLDQFLSHQALSMEINELTFDVVMAAVCERIASIYKDNKARVSFPHQQMHAPSNSVVKKVRARLGDVEAVFNTHSVGAPLQVNGIRVNQNDLEEVLKHAFFYTKQEDYDQFLQDVNRMSLPYRNMVKLGLTIGGSTTPGALFKFQQTSDGRSIELVTSRGVFPIGNGPYLYGRKGWSLYGTDMARFLDRLLKPKQKFKRGSKRKRSDRKKSTRALRLQERMSGLRYLVYLEAVDNYAKMKETLAASIERTASMTDAEESVCTPLNSSPIHGFKVKGDMDEYLISTESDTYANVYRYRTGEYICMVDKSEYPHPEQRLVSRLLVLKNDAAMAGDIDTL